jgi:Serine/threonine protein kinase
MKVFNNGPQQTAFASGTTARKRLHKFPQKISIFHSCLNPCISWTYLLSRTSEHDEKEKKNSAQLYNDKINRWQRASILSSGGQYDSSGVAMSNISRIKQQPPHQQQDLLTNFKLLRDKYDDLKRELHQILWEFIPTQLADNLAGFSDLGQVDNAIFQTPDRIGSYEIGSKLGEGQFSVVKLCTHKFTGKQYAVKIINKDKISSLSGLKRVGIEVKLLHQLYHPNIIKFVDYIHSPTCIYLFTEVCGPDLFEYLQANPSGAGINVTRQIILGIVKPLLYLHNHGICHRDLKPENVLLCKASVDKEIHCHNVRICDFGQSAVATSNSADEKLLLELFDLCGSPGFFAPEMITGADSSYNGYSSDAWSVGCIMLELMMGHENFYHLWMKSYDYEVLKDENKFQSSLYHSIVKILKHIKEATSYDEDGSKGMNSFLRRVLVIDPKLRLNASQMLNHEWFDGFDRTMDKNDFNMNYESKY